MSERNDGFALVDVVVVLVALTIVASIGVMVYGGMSDNNTTLKPCRDEAKAFRAGVAAYHARDDAWPTPMKDGKPVKTASVQAVAAIASLIHGKDSAGETILLGVDKTISLDHLDRTQGGPAVHGWTYNFDQHTTDANTCR